MNWLISNYDVIIGIVILIICCGFSIYKFVNISKDKQIVKVKEWLLFACVEAEKSLGGKGTGRLKLRMVYNTFVRRFKFVSILITFDEFSRLVDEALDVMQDILKNNDSVK